ncbi:glycoside hydrolase family 31 protein [Daldinia caldariorum]|uniref:glycoside hydrolase family 31 protein n=1 Tax=Daldinia caldariorum TaxID=326644 RepID=UPI002008000D|nr:glycoside hydrolase family 31 protein [Daldinia caldariorum]KAI1464834.1 glycoside hydrolase family 31 protein [Daldinia caldariorum]
MFKQYEYVPTNYELVTPHETSPEKTLLLTLLSNGKNNHEKCHFVFEVLRPNVFRTTFTTQEHSLPPYPSANRLKPSLGDVNPEVSVDVEKHSQTINLGHIKIDINWSNTPIVSLSIDDQKKPIHRDLDFRSYTVDGTGIAHYTTYKSDSLHVGLGEKAAPMDLSGRGFNITASDTFGYDAYRTDPLYKHIPLLINATPDGCVGIFSTSHSRATWAVGSELDGLWGHYKVYRQAHGGLEEYLIVGKTIAEVVRSYAELIGFPLLAPRYMMGYIGGGMKYSMEDSPRACDSILNFIKNCEKHGMPCSAFQMSSGYTVAETEPKTRNVFTWNRHRFPDPRGFTRECHKHGVRLLANIKPYVLATHPAYTELSQSGAFFKDPYTSTTAVTRLWSAGGGESEEGSHLDFTSKAGYNWWYNGVKALKEVGIDAMWNDNNEYNLPNDDWQCALETIAVPPGEPRKHVGFWGRALHTELMGKSSHDAAIEIEPKVRPFVLTRSATAGTMRYCASSWSGDNVTSWEGMKGANALALNAGFSLLQCYGHDIGGFEGPQPTPEHLVRWIQLGIHSPRFAINCYKTNPDDNLIGEVIEPWQYPSVAPIIRDAIERRYELIPYTYSLMLKSHQEAIPPQRWTGWGYESDPEVWTKELLKGDTQYWFGDSLLIAGVYEPGVSSARVYLPNQSGSDLGFLNLTAPYQYLEAGRWHEISSTWYSSIPVLARIGSVISTGKPRPTTCIAAEDPEFPSMEKDDYRGVEIFPPPQARYPHWPKGNEISSPDHAPAEIKWFSNTWLEDDGVSPADKPTLCEASIDYGVSSEHIRARVVLKKYSEFEPLWVKNGVTLVLPVGEERPVKLENGGDVEDLGRDKKSRRIWKIDVEVKGSKEKGCATTSMDEFAQLARENFEVFQRYGDVALGSDPKLRVISMCASPQEPITYDEKDLKLSHLPKFFRGRPGSENSHKSATAAPPAASLKLVVIDSRLESWSTPFPSLWVTKDIFLGLVDAMHMSPAALWLLRSEYDGFHYFPSSSAIYDKVEGQEDATADVDTYYVGTSNFVLVWTFNQQTLQTHALWILRQQHSFSSSAPAAWFVNVLRRHQEHLRSPFLLAYVTALSVCCMFDGEISYRAHMVRLTERETGYSRHSSSIEERLGMESITVYIKDVGEVLNHIANNERHFRLIDVVLDFVLDSALMPDAAAVGDESTRRLIATIPLLRRRMHASQEYLKYLKERAERLSTVLFALLTHEDSATNAELADAGRRIAEAARRDSSSMRTVAIMTMAFLPATFFAALFALPSLDWHAESAAGVVQNPGFWVYWAFTLPSTAVVFGLWLLLDRRKSDDGRDRGEEVVIEGQLRDEGRPRSGEGKLG